MVIAFLICFALGLIDWALSVGMVIRVNEALPADRKLSWWRRDSYWGKVNQVYRQQFPQSVLPDLESVFSYTLVALIMILVLVSFYRMPIR